MTPLEPCALADDALGRVPVDQGLRRFPIESGVHQTLKRHSSRGGRQPALFRCFIWVVYFYAALLLAPLRRAPFCAVLAPLPAPIGGCPFCPVRFWPALLFTPSAALRLERPGAPFCPDAGRVVLALPLQSVERGPAPLPGVGVEHPGFQPDDVPPGDRLVECGIQVTRAEAGQAPEFAVGEPHLLAAEAELVLEADGVPNDGPHRLRERQALVADRDVEEGVGDVGAVADPGEEAPERAGVAGIRAISVPPQLVDAALAGAALRLGLPRRRQRM